MAQQASISLKTVCKADELLLCLGPEFGNTGNMSTCGVLFGGDKCKTLRLVGKLSASLSKDLDAAKADSSSQVKVSQSLRVHNTSALSPRTRHWLSASHPLCNNQEDARPWASGQDARDPVQCEAKLQS